MLLLETSSWPATMNSASWRRSTRSTQQRLDSLTQKRYLTDDEKLEEVRLKKLKLRLKDQMQTIERQIPASRGSKPGRLINFPAPVAASAAQGIAFS